MRVNYFSNGEERIVKFNCVTKNVQVLGSNFLCVDGSNVKVIKGTGVSYTPDNFLFKNGLYDKTGYTIDDQYALDDPELTLKWREVEMWKKINPNSLDKKIWKLFFLPTELEYKRFMNDASLTTALNTHNEAASTTRTATTSYGKYEMALDRKSPWTKAHIAAQAYGLINGSNKWFLVMNKNNPKAYEDIKLSKTFPSYWIGQAWDKSRYVNAVDYANGYWMVSTKSNSSIYRQAWKKSATFPKDWVNEKWNDGYSMTHLAYGGGTWAVVASKGSGLGLQNWFIRAYFPDKEIKKFWDEGKYITAIAHGNGNWGVIMSKNSKIKRQFWKKSAVFPESWIKEKWKLNANITSAVYANGEWVIIMTTTEFDPTQEYFYNSTFPISDVRELWGKN